ncbi:hypothetical protein HHK36_020377 [Tetracentron sinense]|uniref:Uncharacterized protein n=1 Tax=Tetracentron sinense TaxID=13715 RepID=A0A835D8S3_TETSI|nr:hypothetical protein HHK36_020377 [Tetracentron sinense]
MKTEVDGFEVREGVARASQIIEGVTVAVVSELVVGGRELLKALRSDAGEIASKFGEFSEDHGSSSNEAVNQRLLAHLRNPRSCRAERRSEVGGIAFLFGRNVRSECHGDRIPAKEVSQRATCARDHPNLRETLDTKYSDFSTSEVTDQKVSMAGMLYHFFPTELLPPFQLPINGDRTTHQPVLPVETPPGEGIIKAGQLRTSVVFNDGPLLKAAPAIPVAPAPASSVQEEPQLTLLHLSCFFSTVTGMCPLRYKETVLDSRLSLMNISTVGLIWAGNGTFVAFHRWLCPTTNALSYTVVQVTTVNFKRYSISYVGAGGGLRLRGSRAGLKVGVAGSAAANSAK